MTEQNKFEKIMKALDVSEMDVADQESLLLDLNELVFRSTMVRLVEEMDNASQEEFNTFVETNPSEEDMSAFLAKRIPNADEIAQEVLQEITNDILSVTHE